MILETKRLILREFVPQDAEALHEIFGDEETMRNCEPAYTPEQTEEFLRCFCIGRRGALAAVRKDSGRLIGYILFKEYEPRAYEIGWIFHKSIRRQGYADEACSALADHAFNQLGAHRLFVEATDPVKSVGLMKKLRMKQEGVLRRHLHHNDGTWVDLHQYGLLREDRLS